jgi:hypothetical protein
MGTLSTWILEPKCPSSFAKLLPKLASYNPRAMPYIPYGVECKNPQCHTGTILGDVWVEAQPLREGAKIEFLILGPTTLRCPTCKRDYEYKQVDLRQFPGASLKRNPN